MRLARHAVLLVALVATGCSRERDTSRVDGAAPARASSGALGSTVSGPSTRGPPVASSPSSMPAPPLASASAPPVDSASAPSAASAALGGDPPRGDAPRPVGGPWVGCYARFRPTSTATRDVTRLALLCGPSNGMRQTGPIVEGEVAPGASRDHAVALERGQCVRAFAVAEVPIADLDLALVAPGGATLAVDGIDDRWPVLQPDRAVCVVESGTYLVRVSSRVGAGRYALSVWMLP